MSPFDQLKRQLTRRTFLSRSTAGFGSVVLASLLDTESGSAAGRVVEADHKAEADKWLGAVRPRHFAPRANRAIFLYMAGGPSQLESFSYKPKLAEMDGKPMPEPYTKGQPIAQLQGTKQLTCLAPQYKFRRWGKAQQEISEIFPHIGSVADDICIIRSMVTDPINHAPGHTFMQTGTALIGRPAIGSWLTYGLGSGSDNLPGFVVLTSVGKGGLAQPVSTRLWHSGFLPSRFQGVEFRAKGDPVLYLGSPDGVTHKQQRAVVAAVQKLNQAQDDLVDDPEIATRISAYETAVRMQTSVPELVDVSDEPQHVLELYGTQGADGTFAANCLLARRLAERGVRFIQLYHRAWDHHVGIKKNFKVSAEEVDRASAALIQDLKRRGMLDDTLVVWGGEFGRTPMAQGNGRDHHIKGFSIWMAGGGIQGGITHGDTDELGYYAVDDVVHVHDFHATLLHLFGIDHKRLTYKFQGRDFRLTDVAGNVVKAILS